MNPYNWRQRLFQQYLRPILHTDKARFVVVGGIGFCVDGFLFSVFLAQCGIPALARGLSFPIALCCTWYLNHIWTFQNATPRQFSTAFLFYVAFQCLGATLNFCIFLGLIHAIPIWAAFPLIPLAIASAIAMIFNYITAKYLVFA